MFEILELLLHLRVFILDMNIDFAWNLAGVDVLIINNAHVILVHIRILQSIKLRFGYVNNPVGGHLAVTSDRLLEHFFFRDGRHLNIIELAPATLELVLDEGKVVAWLSTAIVHTDRVDVVRSFVKVRVCLLDSVL